MKYILSFDQGTTSSRAIVFNQNGEIVSVAQKEFEQIFPKPGWVEHDPNEIWSSQASVAAEAISRIGINGKSIAAIGITNQRETAVLWDKESGKPVYNAIVWQDRRTADTCDELKEQGYTDLIRNKTGLIIDSYFAGTKVKWILDNIPGVRQKALKGKIAFGTVDSWLIWKMTKGKKHITDVTNACRTLLFNIHTMEWDEELLKLFDIPESILPEVVSSSGVLAETSTATFAHPIIGQQCAQPGLAKSTYGTGSFMLTNTGTAPVTSKNNLLTTIAWRIGDNKVQYALEGSIFIAGAVVQWLRDQLGLIKTSSEIEALANTVEDNGGVYFVPALTGLGAPYWDSYARGTILGLTRGSNKGHLARAALEGIAFQTMDILHAMEADSGIQIKELRVDGGASANDLLMQFQSELLGIPVVRPKVVETTALGAAYLAGLAVGYWEDLNNLQQHWKKEKVFTPELPREKVKKMLYMWEKALEKSQNWFEED